MVLKQFLQLRLLGLKLVHNRLNALLFLDGRLVPLRHRVDLVLGLNDHHFEFSWLHNQSRFQSLERSEQFDVSTARKVHGDFQSGFL